MRDVHEELKAKNIAVIGISPDTPETQKKRIDVYMDQTAPLIEWYRSKALLAPINGEQTIEQVAEELRETVYAAIGDQRVSKR